MVVSPAPDYFDNDTESDVWYIGDDDLYIHPHWWKYDIHLIPDWHFYAIGVAVGIFGIVGCIGNGLVILTYLKEKSLRTPPNMFVINLAVSDFVYSGVNGFPLFTIASFEKRWNWGMTACELYALIAGISGLVSIYTNVAIAIDRFFVIVQPIQTMNRMSHTKAGIAIVFIWMWCTGIGCLPIAGIGRYIPEGFQTSCTFDYLTRDTTTVAYNLFLYFCAYILPMTVIILCYWQIVKAVANHEREMAKMAEKLGTKDMRSGNNIRADIKTAKVSFTIISFWFITWSPYAYVCFFSTLGYYGNITPYVAEIPVVFSKAAAMWNPFIYAVSHPRFREGMERVAPCFFVCCKEKKKDLSRERSANHSKMDNSSDGESVRVKSNQDGASKGTINTVAGGIEETPA